MTTHLISCSDYALVHNIIPSMDILTHVLNKFKDNTTLKLIMRAVAAHSLQIMNKYYSRTNDSKIYCITMSEPSVLS